MNFNLNDLKIKIAEPLYPDLMNEYDMFDQTHWDTVIDNPNAASEEFFRSPTFITEARINNELVGITLCFLGDLVFENESIKYAGIGGVLVHKEFRLKGIATVMTDFTMVELKKRGIQIALLNTDIETKGKIYAKSGFVPLNRPYFFTNVYGKECEDNSGMIAPCADVKCFEKVLNSSSKLDVGIGDF